ncbi:MAG: SAM-dependent DNA methyltransferase [Desulfobacteraceae bacterium]|nr:MAG: SAM-dependent DNA methyltransferase [Desulfobacteraceae bacterium]
MIASTGANLGFEDKLWNAADKLRGTMDAAEYKHVVLGLIFLKYISDAFLEKHAELEAETYADPEDRDEYNAANIFWVPKEARWTYLQGRAKDPKIGLLIDEAMSAIERDNTSLKGVLPKDYARPALDKSRLGELIDLIATIGLGDRESRKKDILGRVYEYFLAQFAEKEGKGGGEFYTPQCVVKLLVEMIEPFKGRVYDPCCGSGGMFVQAMRFVQAHANGNGNGSKYGALREIAVYGQEMNYTTFRLAKMNMAIRGIDADIRWNEKGSFLQDAHKDLKADFILANPPFNDEDWGFSKVKDDVRWAFGKPPAGGARKQKDGSSIHVDGGNANYAWIQHFIHHLAPDGFAGFVLANGSMSTNTSGEGDIRKALIESDMVDCMIAMPGQLFYTTQIPVCLWFLTRSKKSNAKSGFRSRAGETLFIDARKMGTLIDRTHRELSDAEIAEIGRTYHAWRGEEKDGVYEDKLGFCKSATLADIRVHHHVLTPGRYVGAEAVEDDGVAFEEKMAELSDRLYQQMRESLELDAVIRRNLEVLDYGE